jgi:hypothetical protein
LPHCRQAPPSDRWPLPPHRMIARSVTGKKHPRSNERTSDRQIARSRQCATPPT